ncbi:MAG: hypothetical protein A3F70_09145 [Acidobacteria bacterium RIFCSPLOWO2_12_FULL_67_14]|nr:MAG: hypothetical protein A3H29_02985 [Acidobacteria bacterium RIFCSPLOWO2_02_FULL_67_21]OFW40661.1 MAG: hypothetical protein A3F70_09145 [Acidobacteria bacterium RIFCSPLOWO2_12_FULL_67_14]
MAGVDSVLRKAQARLQAAERDQGTAERTATAAKRRFRRARLTLKKAKKRFKKAAKVARKAGEAAEAARKSFSKASTRVRKEKKRAKKARKTRKTAAPEEPGRAARILARKASHRKAVPQRGARKRPRRRAPTVAVRQHTRPDEQPQAETFELGNADLI